MYIYKNILFGFDILFLCDTSGYTLTPVKGNISINKFYEHETSLAMSTNGKQSKTEDQRDPNSNSMLDKLHYDKTVAIIFLNMQVENQVVVLVREILRCFSQN